MTHNDNQRADALTSKGGNPIPCRIGRGLGCCGSTVEPNLLYPHPDPEIGFGPTLAGQAEGPQWCTNPCTGPLVLQYNWKKKKTPLIYFLSFKLSCQP